jgi:hypothetical protein
MRKPLRLRAGLAAAALAVETGGMIATAVSASASTGSISMLGACQEPGQDQKGGER